MAKMENKLETSSFVEHFGDYRKTFCNHPKALLAVPQGDQ